MVFDLFGSLETFEAMYLDNKILVEAFTIIAEIIIKEFGCLISIICLSMTSQECMHIYYVLGFNSVSSWLRTLWPE